MGVFLRQADASATRFTGLEANLGVLSILTRKRDVRLPVIIGRLLTRACMDNRLPGNLRECDQTGLGLVGRVTTLVRRNNVTDIRQEPQGT